MEARSTRRWALIHGLLAFLVCAIIPAQSWLHGTGARAWTMYARSATYRLRVAAYDERGELRWVAPSELSQHSEGDLASALGGAESFRLGPQGFALRDRLPRLAELACTVSRATRVTLSLDLREAIGQPTRRTEASRTCAAF